MTRADFETALQTYFWGPLCFIQAVVPAMRERGEGRIVDIPSVGGKVSRCSTACAGARSIHPSSSRIAYR
jgi:NAD(P)-dependent dehydrogenase (short-subunit alcohol dehydrogenase family)